MRMWLAEMGGNRDKVLAVADTIAAMNDSPSIDASHLCEAIQYRPPRNVRQWDPYEEIRL